MKRKWTIITGDYPSLEYGQFDRLIDIMAEIKGLSQEQLDSYWFYEQNEMGVIGEIYPLTSLRTEMVRFI